MIGALSDMFSSAIFIFSSMWFLNMCKPRTGLRPARLGFYGKGLASLTIWLGMVNAGWLGSSHEKFSYKWNLWFFKVVPTNRLSFYLGSSLQIVSLWFSHFYLFQNAILHIMLKVGFRNFKSIFLRVQFSLVATFFSLVLGISLSWYFYLTISYLTLVILHFKRLQVIGLVLSTSTQLAVKWIILMDSTT